VKVRKAVREEVIYREGGKKGAGFIGYKYLLN